MNVLLATQKPFSANAAAGIKNIVTQAGHTLTVLENYKDQSDLVKAVKAAEALIVRSDIVDAAVVKAASNLKIVVRAGAGYDNIDLAACTKRNIVVMNTPGQNSNDVSDL